MFGARLLAQPQLVLLRPPDQLCSLRLQLHHLPASQPASQPAEDTTALGWSSQFGMRGCALPLATRFLNQLAAEQSVGMHWVQHRRP